MIEKYFRFGHQNFGDLRLVSFCRLLHGYSSVQKHMSFESGKTKLEFNRLALTAVRLAQLRQYIVNTNNIAAVGVRN